MNRGTSDCRLQTANCRLGGRLWFGLALVLALAGCFRLDSFLFDPKPVTEYLQMTSADSAE